MHCLGLQQLCGSTWVPTMPATSWCNSDVAALRRWFVIVPLTCIMFVAFPALRGFLAQQVPRHMQGRLQGGLCVRAQAVPCCSSRASSPGAIGALNTLTTAFSPLLSAGIYSASEKFATTWPPERGELHLPSAAMWLVSSLLLLPVLALCVHIKYVRAASLVWGAVPVK